MVLQTGTTSKIKILMELAATKWLVNMTIAFK